MRELLLLPNLVSLVRIPIAFAMVYCISREGASAIIAAAILMILAGVSDALDGYLARRLGQVTPLGIALDPIADKIFAGILVLGLIVYREFPVWLALAIVGRDLLILIVGLIIMRGKRLSLPSNLTGKYAFGAVAVLIAGYVIRFPFGITMVTPIALILLLASFLSYARVAVKAMRGQPTPAFRDRQSYRLVRSILAWGLSFVWLAALYLHLVE